MRSITFQWITEQPDEESFRLFPDFLITRLICKGQGRIEARYPSPESEFVQFIFKTRDGLNEKIIGEIGRGFFRSVLAQFAGRCHIENLYAGHAFFSCDIQVHGEIKKPRFSLFICNERTMDFWLILYFYGVGDLEPFQTES